MRDPTCSCPVGASQRRSHHSGAQMPLALNDASTAKVRSLKRVSMTCVSMCIHVCHCVWRTLTGRTQKSFAQALRASKRQDTPRIPLLRAPRQPGRPPEVAVLIAVELATQLALQTEREALPAEKSAQTKLQATPGTHPASPLRLENQAESLPSRFCTTTRDTTGAPSRERGAGKVAHCRAIKNVAWTQAPFRAPRLAFARFRACMRTFCLCGERTATRTKGGLWYPMPRTLR